jgi:hypothetical protein
MRECCINPHQYISGRRGAGYGPHTGEDVLAEFIRCGVGHPALVVLRYLVQGGRSALHRDLGDRPADDSAQARFGPSSSTATALRMFHPRMPQA